MENEKQSIKILIIEDDPNIVALIKMYMTKLGYDTLVAYDGQAGLESYFEEAPDCIILDIMLPEINGWEVCKMIRIEDKTVPIIMLTGKGQSYDIVKGLNIGADDYIVKPFDPNELTARVRAVLRRIIVQKENEDIVTFSNLTINKKEFRVIVGHHDVTLAPREMEMLCFFAANPNQVLSRQQLLDKIWGFDFDGDPRTIDVHIKRIRDKLSANGAHWSVTTIRGVGYRFEEMEND